MTLAVVAERIFGTLKCQQHLRAYLAAISGGALTRWFWQLFRHFRQIYICFLDDNGCPLRQAETDQRQTTRPLTSSSQSNRKHKSVTSSWLVMTRVGLTE